MMYRSEYGNNYLFFIIGALAGIYIVYFVSKLIGDNGQQFIRILSTGNILTLGIHPYFVQVYNHLHSESLPVALVSGIIIMAIMYPIIKFVLKHMPFVIGRSPSS